ncbi:MAG TPA: hypothetical protein VK196_20215 [Magnetospirillum sp.]|nr:hypothetical protein [Magnetospirillum sp.]
MRVLLGIIGWIIAALGLLALIVSGLCGGAVVLSGLNLQLSLIAILCAGASFNAFWAGRALFRWGMGPAADSQATIAGEAAPRGGKWWLAWGLIVLGGLLLLDAVVTALNILIFFDIFPAGASGFTTVLSSVAGPAVVGGGLVAGGLWLRKANRPPSA